MSHWETLSDMAVEGEANIRVIGVRTHGKRSTYKHGCRCERCREANAEYHTRLNHKKRQAVESTA